MSPGRREDSSLSQLSTLSTNSTNSTMSTTSSGAPKTKVTIKEHFQVNLMASTQRATAIVDSLMAYSPMTEHSRRGVVIPPKKGSSGRASSPHAHTLSHPYTHTHSHTASVASLSSLDGRGSPDLTAQTHTAPADVKTQHGFAPSPVPDGDRERTESSCPGSSADGLSPRLSASLVAAGLADGRTQSSSHALGQTAQQLQQQQQQQHATSPSPQPGSMPRARGDSQIDELKDGRDRDSHSPLMDGSGNSEQSQSPSHAHTRERPSSGLGLGLSSSPSALTAALTKIRADDFGPGPRLSFNPPRSFSMCSTDSLTNGEYVPFETAIRALKHISQKW